MAFTKVVGAGIHTLSNIASHNINSSGIITATKFVGPIEGNITAVDGVFTGNVSIAKTLTYEDVKNVDSVGIVTAREGVFIPDNKKLEIGNASGSGDLQLYHSPSDNNNSFIKHTGTGALKIAADHFRFRNKNDNSNILNGLSGGAVTLYFNNAEKLKTISDGIEVPDAIRHINDTNTAIRFPADDTISLETGGTQGVRLTSAQKLLVGDHTVSRSIGNSEHIIQTEGTNAGENGISLYSFTSNQHAAHFSFGKSRNNSSVADNDYLGHIIWCAHDGTDVNSTSARITASIDGTPGSNDTPGRLEFYTTSDGVQIPTERLRIDSSGRVGIGTISPTALLHLHKTSGDTIQKIESSNGAASLELRHTNGYGYINYRQSGAETFRVGQIAQFTSYSVYNPNSSLPYQLCVEGNGEVGINTHNPGDTLHLLRNNANHGIRLQRAGTNPGSAYVQVHSNGVLSLQGGNNIHYVSGGSQQHIWYRAATEIARFNTSGHLLPGAAGTQNLGSTTAEWGDVYIADNKSVYLGSDQDARIYHTGSAGYITNSTGILRITGASGQKIDFYDGASGGFYARFNSGNSVELHFGGAGARLSTASYGVQVHGNVRANTGGEGYTFINDPDTGMHNPSDGNLRFKVNGTDRLSMHTSGISTFHNQKLHIEGAGSGNTPLTINTDVGSNNSVHPLIEAYSDNATYKTQIGLVREASSGNLGWAFFTNAVGSPQERLRITSSGNVGINSASPSTRLDVIHQGGGGTAYDVLTLGGAGHGNNTFPKIRFRTTTNSNTLGRIGIYDAGAQTSYSGDFVVELNTGGSPTNTTHEKFRVTADGKVGINDSDPERTMDIRGSNCMIQLEGTAGNGRQWSLVSSDDATGTSVDGGPPGAFVIYDDTSSTRRFRIQSDGNSEINVSGGSFKAEGTGAYGMSIHNTNSPSMGHLFIYGDNGLIRFRNNSSVYTAQMGYAESNNTLFFTNQEGGTSMFINADGVQLYDNNKFLCGNDKDLEIFHNNSHGFVNTDTGHLYLQTGGNSRVQVSTDGSCYFGPQIITEADMGWGHDAHQRPFVFSGNQAGVNPADATIVAANPNTDPSSTRLGGFMFGCKSSGAGNSGIKAYIEGYTTANPSTAYQSGGYMRFVSRASGGNLTELVRLNASSSGGVDIFGEAAQNDSTSGARGVDISVSGHQSVPVYFGTEHNAAQKSMYLNGYWIYLRGHVNEGIRFVFSQSSGAPHGSRFQFKYNQCLNSSNSTTWNTSSDGRAKENVQTITNGIETIKKLRPVTYDWTNDYADSVGMYVMGKDESGGFVAKKENGYDTDRKNGQYGFIAQEYETVLPKDVMKDKYTLGGTELDDFRTMTNDSLLPSLTAALKEAIAKIEVLEAKVAALEGS